MESKNAEREKRRNGALVKRHALSHFRNQRLNYGRPSSNFFNPRRGEGRRRRSAAFR
jgi:hypothetical protein